MAYFIKTIKRMMSELLCKVFDADLICAYTIQFLLIRLCSLLRFLASDNILLCKIPVDYDAADVWSRREDFHAHVPWRIYAHTLTYTFLFNTRSSRTIFFPFDMVKRSDVIARYFVIHDAPNSNAIRSKLRHENISMVYMNL